MFYIDRSILQPFTNLPEGVMRTRESSSDRRTYPVTAKMPATVVWYGGKPTTGIAGSIC